MAKTTLSAAKRGEQSTSAQLQTQRKQLHHFDRGAKRRVEKSLASDHSNRFLDSLRSLEMVIGVNNACPHPEGILSSPFRPRSEATSGEIFCYG